MDCPDEEDLRRLRRGDERAFEALAVRWSPTILHVALRLTGDLEEARDVRQLALMRIYDSRDDFAGRARFSTWLYRVVVNLCRDAHRRRDARARSQEVAGRNGRHLDVATPEHLAEARDTAERVARAVAALRAEDREVVALRHYAGLAFPAVAEVLEAPVTTVKSRMARALRALRTELEELRPDAPSPTVIDP